MATSAASRFVPPLCLYTVAGIRAIEGHYLADAQPPLMERAGAAAARLALQLVADDAAPVLVLAGPGNNGGDGLVLARHLQAAGHAVVVAFAGDAQRLPDDARQAHQAWLAAGGRLQCELPPAPGHFSLAVDALFGIGLQRPLSGTMAEWVAYLNQLTCPVLALDIASGLDADSGRVLGSAVRASHTLSFIGAKPGLFTLDGPDHSGQIHIADLDLVPSSVRPADGQLLGPALFQQHLRPRQLNSHKGSHGSAAILGGAPGMVGAALLAGRAALKLGAGRVFVGLIDDAGPTVDLLQPELMLRRAEAVLDEGIATCLAVGPGLGKSQRAAQVLALALSSELPLLLDADALNLLATDNALAALLIQRQAETILTPHPAEAARLLAWDVAQVQWQRIASAQELARRCHCPVVLKGCGSVVATPDGSWWINDSGNPGMASAGMGDVLAGLTLALLAQGWPATAALSAAVHLHGAAADALVAAGNGPVGLAAGELIDAARHLLNRWIAA